MSDGTGDDKRTKRGLWRRLTVASLLLATYVNSYIVLSVLGGYHWSQCGRLRWDHGRGLAVTDRTIWHSRFTWWEPFRDVSGRDASRGNTLGYFYSPLIRLDRAWFHPTSGFDGEPFED